MPQPTVSDVHVSAALTNISVAYRQDASAYIAERLFPVVPVVHKTDTYYIYRKGDWFRDDVRPRADATESAGGGFNLDTATYNAEVYAFHKDVGAQVRANADPAIDIDAAAAEFCMQSMLINRERRFMSSFMATGLWATDVTGGAGTQWDDDGASDPFTAIELGRTTILQSTGHKPNVMVMGWAVYQALKKHPLVIDRIKYTNPAFAGDITSKLLAQVFDLEEVLVSEAVYNSAREGATVNMQFIMGKHALLAYRPRSPGLLVPASGYTFVWSGLTGLNSNGVRAYQIPMDVLGLGTIRNEVEMAYAQKVVASDMGYFFSGIVS